MTHEVGGPDRVPPLVDDLPRLAESIGRASGVLLCLDFDGTLAPIVADPDDAELLAECRRALSTLQDRPTVDVAIVSGRELVDVRDRVGLDGVTYVGNHGLERWHDGVRTPHPEAEHHRSAVGAAAESVRERLDSVPGTEVEDKGLTATVHFRRADDEASAEAREAVRSVAASEDVVCSRGKEVAELRPAIEWDKGDAVRSIRPPSDDRLVVYVGDDRTDEDAFEAIGPRGVAVHVGDGRETAADYRLADPDAVASFLEWLVEETGA